MRPWSEIEVFSFLADHFAKAASACDDLARNRRRGPVYNELRHDLEKIENMCRIANYMRQDARWLQVGLRMHAAHQCAGDWLRGVPRKPDAQGKPQPPMAIPEGELHPLFVRLAEFLREQAKEADRLRRERTGRVGMILPRMLVPPGVRQPTNYRVTPLHKSSGGVIIPRGVNVA
jgi:hypothetical protein